MTCPGQIAAAMNVWTDVDVGSQHLLHLTEAIDDLLEQLSWFDSAVFVGCGQIWALGDVICAGAEFEARDLD